MVQPTPRTNNTMREALLWVGRYPDDTQLEFTASFVGDLVCNWRRGEISAEQVVRKIGVAEDRMIDTDDWDSPSGILLAQAPMWFGYETDLDIDIEVPIQKF